MVKFTLGNPSVFNRAQPWQKRAWVLTGMFFLTNSLSRRHSPDWVLVSCKTDIKLPDIKSQFFSAEYLSEDKAPTESSSAGRQAFCHSLPEDGGLDFSGNEYDANSIYQSSHWDNMWHKVKFTVANSSVSPREIGQNFSSSAKPNSG